MNTISRAVSCGLFSAATLYGCDSQPPDGLSAPHAPRGFSPASAVAREGDRTARCNTVHSLTLPTAIVERYSIAADEERAVLSCSLQIDEGGTMRNIPAEISGTATLLTGRETPLEFKEILDNRAVSYLSPFSIEAKQAIDFHVRLTDRQTNQTYDVRLHQDELPGRK